MFKTPIACAAAAVALGCAEPEPTAEADDQLTSALAGWWEGYATYEGPPACPYPGGCNHDVALFVGCSGSVAWAEYDYHGLDFWCASDLELDSVDGRVQYWTDTSTTRCTHGRVTLGPAVAGGGLGFRWERAGSLAEDTKATLQRTAWAVCL